MKNFKNYLMGIVIDGGCFDYLKHQLLEKYNLKLLIDLLSLPCMQHMERNTLGLLIALLEDGENNDFIVEKLCDTLINITPKIWDEYKKILKSFIELNFSMLNRSQKLCLAHTIEVMYAKGYKHTFTLATIIYKRIPLTDTEFNPDSDDNVRINLAKIAYSTTKCNFNDKINEIEYIKFHIKTCGRKYLIGLLNYYKGICLRAAGVHFNYKDDTHYIMKSSSKDFALANIYCNYHYNIETSNR